MSLFNFFQKKDINEYIKNLSTTENTKLIDVRTREEYTHAHIPQSINIPLDNLSTITTKIPNKQTPIFVYCRSGARSQQAQNILQSMGYTNVTNIGGIVHYKGNTEKGV